MPSFNYYWSLSALHFTLTATITISQISLSHICLGGANLPIGDNHLNSKFFHIFQLSRPRTSGQSDMEKVLIILQTRFVCTWYFRKTIILSFCKITIFVVEIIFYGLRMCWILNLWNDVFKIYKVYSKNKKEISSTIKKYLQISKFPQTMSARVHFFHVCGQLPVIMTWQ